MSNHDDSIGLFKKIGGKIDMDKLNMVLSGRSSGVVENGSDVPVAYVKGCSVGWIQPQAGQLKDRQPLYAKSIKINEVDNQKLFKALEFAEYMAKKAEQYIEEYSLLEEERFNQAFDGKKDNEKLFQMEQELGEISTQLKIYIYEFRKRHGAANMLNLQ
jgi:hypothetical protein